MHESTIPVHRRSTPRATLAALELKFQQLDLFAPIRHQVHVPQKTVRYTPTDKLYDALITILAGAHGVVECNTRLRSDPNEALQATRKRQQMELFRTIYNQRDGIEGTISQGTRISDLRR